MKEMSVRKSAFSAMFLICLVLIPTISKSQTLCCELTNKNINCKIFPESLQVLVNEEIISAPQSRTGIENLIQRNNHISFDRGGCKINVSLEKEYLNILFNLKMESTLTFPVISNANSFLLPIGEGLFFPAKDQTVINYFIKQDVKKVVEKFSMPFFGAVFGKYSSVYILDNADNINYSFTKEPNGTKLSFTHESIDIPKLQQFSYRIYIFEGDIVTLSAKFYRDYKISKSEFKTLAEKAEKKQNIKKLYGAPFIYLWVDELVSEDNVKWKQLQRIIKKELAKQGPNPTKYFSSLLDRSNSFTNIGKQDYVSNYDKTSFDSDLIALAERKDLYKENIFNSTELNSEVKSYLNKGVDNLNQMETIQFNTNLIQSVYKDSMAPVGEWGNGVSVYMIDQLHKSGINKAWFGINDASLSYFHPQAISMANRGGYLIAPYDSYHSITVNKEDLGKTSYFEDRLLYDDATVIKRDGTYNSGFLGKGRILNSTLLLPTVKERIKRYFDQGIEFNSWFVDCDGAGELYTDYSKKHQMSEREDAAARNSRMKWIGDEFGAVVGTEDGKDYVAGNIAFGHGVVTPVWWNSRDIDVAKNKTSEYYLGEYYSTSGIPPRYIKKTKLKPEIKHIYFNPKIKVPLFQLVYNNCVIPSDHWEEGILKFSEVTKVRLIQCVLFNVPPLFHLDRQQWEKDKYLIVSFLKFWSPLHEKLVQMEMTDFKYLSDDRLLQKTTFGDGTEIIANFGDGQTFFKDMTIPPISVIVIEKERKETYSSPD